MTWFKFKKTFTYKPVVTDKWGRKLTPSLFVYEAGDEVFVTEECAQLATEAGCGSVMDEKPKNKKTDKRGSTIDKLVQSVGLSE